mmetsp:Transcript_46907/g.77865  ORF Transcript_46907/g.77865 Transcript_46907/m.77865 type:complete len:225 (+) Transcript_46907:47-721(+)
MWRRQLRAAGRSASASPTPRALTAAAASSSGGIGAAAEGSAHPRRKKRVGFQDEPEFEEVTSSEDDDTDSEEGKETQTQVWGWFDDLLEGFATIYATTVGGVHTCTSATGRSIYPVKECAVDCIDRTFTGRHRHRPNTSQLASSFAHEETEGEEELRQAAAAGSGMAAATLHELSADAAAGPARTASPTQSKLEFTVSGQRGKQGGEGADSSACRERPEHVESW